MRPLLLAATELRLPGLDFDGIITRVD